MSMWRQIFVYVCFSLLCAAVGVNSAFAITLAPGADIGASGNAQTPQLKASAWNHAFLRFDLTGHRNISNARLRLYSNGDKNLKTRAWLASSDDWDESRSKPSAIGYLWFLPLATQAGQSTHTQGYFEIDVTDAVKAEAGGDGVISFEIGNDSMSWQSYGARNSANPPQLILVNGSASAGNQPPVAALTVSSSNAIAPARITFNGDNSTDPDGYISHYEWLFGNGASSRSMQASHTFNEPGNYEVVLKVTDNDGSSASTSHTITVHAGDVKAAGTRILLPSDDRGAADNGSAPQISASTWDHAFIRFDLGALSQLSHARLRLNYHGTSSRTSRIWAANSDHWSESSGVPDEIGYPWYHSEKIAEIFHGNGYVEFDVTDFVRRQIQSDGIASFELSNDAAGYLKYGSRESSTPPQLVILGSNISNSDNLNPAAVISQDRSSGAAPLTVSFNGSGSSDQDGFIFSYDWDFNDGGHSNSINPHHVFTTPGTYRVSLTATDNTGGTHRSTTTIQVFAPSSNLPPSAKIRALPSIGAAPLAVTFDASESIDPDGNIRSYEWDFGFGAQTLGKTAQFTFTRPGQYPVKLVVTDDKGARSSTTSLTVTATDSYNANIFAPVTSTAQQNVYFIGNSVTDGIRYHTLETLASNAGKVHRWGRQMTPGAPLEWIWNHPYSGVSESPYGYYQQALRQNQWSSLSLQPFDRRLANDLDYASRFMAMALTSNPQIQVYVFSYYPRLNQGDWESQWLADSSVNTSRAYFQALADGLSSRHPRAKRVRQFPVGEVMYRLKQQIDAGNVTGLNSITNLYNDNVHLNGRGEFLVTMTVYAMLYKTNPSGLSFAGYQGMNQQLARIIQQQVWSVVQEYLHK